MATNNDIKKIETGKEAQEIIKRVTKKVCDIVSSTLGPAGRTALIDRNYRYPENTDDGFTVAEQLVFHDELENLVAQAVIQGSSKANELVGDGTTTSAALVWAIYENALKLVDTMGIKIKGVKSTNAHQVCVEIQQACDKAIELLKKQAKKVKTKKDIVNIATVSVKDEVEGAKIGEMAWELGENMFIDVTEDSLWETAFELNKGMRFPAKIASQTFITNTKGECEISDYKVLVTTYDLDDVKKTQFIVADETGAVADSVCILAPRFSKEVLDFLIQFNYSCFMKEKKASDKGDKIKLPRLVGFCIPALTSLQAEDAAIYVGGKLKDRELGTNLETIASSDFGTAKKIVATGESLIILNGGGKKEDVEARISQMKEIMDNKIKKHGEADLEVRQLKIRISSMSSGVGKIRAGGKTDSERLRKKRKYDDAVGACKAAFEEGFVQGGGLALVKVSQELGDTPITEALKAPHQKILENIGDPSYETPETVIDSVKATRIALESACSVAQTLLMTDTLIAFRRNKIEDLRNLING